jgi:hypothetical protein
VAGIYWIAVAVVKGMAEQPGYDPSIAQFKEVEVGRRFVDGYSTPISLVDVLPVQRIGRT